MLGLLWPEATKSSYVNKFLKVQQFQLKIKTFERVASFEISLVY